MTYEPVHEQGLLTLDPNAVRAGDIVFVFSPGVRSSLNVVGQSAMRLRTILSRGHGPARYSHVMLGIARGLVIHADGKSTKIQPLTEALQPPYSRDDLLVRRPDPELSDAQGITLALAARAHLGQKYSFIPGRRSSVSGQLVHGRKTLTHPFCSELIAIAFKALDRPLAKRPPDRVLPVDLEINCIPPAWRDVTDLYLKDAVTGLSHRDELPPEARAAILQMAQIEKESSLVFDELFKLEAADADRIRQTTQRNFQAMLLVMQLRDVEFEASKRMSAQPVRLFTDFWSMAKDDLAALPNLYRAMERGEPGEGTPFYDELCHLHAEVPEDSPLYENFPSISALRRLELGGLSLGLFARLIRVEALLVGVGVATWMPVPDRDREKYQGLTTEMAARVLSAIPPLSKDEMEKVLGLVAGWMAQYCTFDSVKIGRLCENVVRLHAVVAALRDVAAPEGK